MAPRYTRAAGIAEEGTAHVRALLSVANREGLSAFARELQTLGVELVATDGTREHLAADGIDAASVSELTAVPPLVGGQVRTFHPAIYAGILARRDRDEQLLQLADHGIGLIDLVVVNVKPFAPEVGRGHIGIDEAIELIDVAGAALLGAAARNAAGVAAASSPAHYGPLLEELRDLGQVSADTRYRLAADAFGTVAAYYAEIAAYLNQISNNTYPSRLAMVLEKVSDLPYGENPHQRAAFYRETTHRSGSLADAHQLHGAPPTFNNLMDLDAAYRIASDYTAPTVAITKHTDPVGLASAEELVDAYRRALDTDPVSSFGGIVGVNRELDEATAQEIAANSYEAVIAPGFSEAALALLRHKQGLELLAVPGLALRGDARLRHRQPRLQARRRRAAGRGPRRRRPRPRPAPGRDPAPPDARRADRPAVRVARRADGPLERDHPRPQRGDGRDRGGPGEPQRRGGHRPAAGRRPRQARGHGLGRVLPVPRRHPDRGQRRGDGDHPAGRVDPRRDGDRGREPPSPRDGVHGAAPFPALRRGSPMEKLLALEMVRVTEAAAIASARFMGKGERDEADRAATEAMRRTMDETDLAGTIVIGEGERDEAPMLYIGEQVGRHGVDGVTGVDIAVDPLEGTNLVATGQGGAITVLAASETGGLTHAPGHLPGEARRGTGRRGVRRHHAAARRELPPDRRGAAPQGERHHGDHPRPAAPRGS